jgi:hypothetical protein
MQRAVAATVTAALFCLGGVLRRDNGLDASWSGKVGEDLTIVERYSKFASFMLQLDGDDEDDGNRERECPTTNSVSLYGI